MAKGQAKLKRGNGNLVQIGFVEMRVIRDCIASWVFLPVRFAVDYEAHPHPYPLPPPRKGEGKSRAFGAHVLGPGSALREGAKLVRDDSGGRDGGASADAP